MKLFPIPRTWTFENLRDLLQRAHVPCPLAWSLQLDKRIAMLEYQKDLHQAEAIEKLDAMPVAPGEGITATPVNVEVHAHHHELDREVPVSGASSPAEEESNNTDSQVCGGQECVCVLAVGAISVCKSVVHPPSQCAFHLHRGTFLHSQERHLRMDDEDDALQPPAKRRMLSGTPLHENGGTNAADVPQSGPGAQGGQ